MSGPSWHWRQCAAPAAAVALRRVLTGALLAGAALTAAVPVAHAEAAPPKSIKDLVAQIEAATPQPARIAELNAVLAEAFPAGAPVAGQIAFLRRQAQAAEELGHAGKELELKRRNAELARGTPDAARVLMELAVRERNYGDLTQAMRLVDEVIALAPPPGLLIGAYGRVAIDRILMGDVAGADEAQANAEAAYRRAMLNARIASWFRSFWRNQLECLHGSHLALRGKLTEADAAYRRSIDAAIEDARIAPQRFGTPGLTAPHPDVSQGLRDVCELNWARNLMQQRRHVDAEVLLRAQVERVMARVGRDSPQVANALGGLGALYARQGRYADAEALLGEAVRIYERVGAENGSGLVGRARGEYALALYVRGAYAEAVAQVERWSGAPERNPGSGPAYLMALVRSGQGARALPVADELLRRIQTRYGERHPSTGHAKGARAMALQASGANAEALALYRDAVRTIADARVRSADDGSESLNKRIFGHILEGYLGLLADMQGPEFSHLFKQLPALESFAVADLIRAGSVQKALAASAARASADPALAEVVRREQDFGEELAALQRTLGSLLAAPLEKQLTKVIAGMRARIASIEKEQAGLAAQIEQRFPAYANLIAPKPPTQAETQRVLRDGEALLAVLVGESRTFIWAVPKSGAAQFHAAAAGARQIEALTARVRRTVDPFSHGLPGVPPFALDDAHAIYRLVVAPVAATLGDAKQVIVSANGVLGAFPFAMLPTAPVAVNIEATPAYVDYRKVPWLLRRHAITQVPSVNALVTLRALPARAAAGSGSGSGSGSGFAGIGDPIFSRAQMTALSADGTSVSVRGASVTVRGGAQVALRSAGRLDQIDSAELGRLERLPDTSDEVREIAAIFGAGSDVLLQASANEKEVKGRDWRRKRVILFATHGLVPGELNGLDQPALALTAPDVAGIDGDGLLTVEEILNLKLDADWVVLSACNTASGSVEGAEALSGLGRAFFYAGTRALLASNWPVETVSAKMITTGIFKRQAAQLTLSKADALRATMLDLIDAGEAKDSAGKPVYSYAHPMFWAPFSLVGDGS